MSAMANQAGAINLAQGFPDFSPSSKLMRLVNEAMVAGHNQYAPMPGILPLRQRLCDKIHQLYGAVYDPETEITITAGATQALYTALTALVRQGDEVIVIEPAYDSYIPAIQLNGGIPVYVKLRAPEFTVNWDEITSKISDKTRLILINTPHNPTGAVWQASDLLTLQALAEKYDFLVISDEVYEHLVFDGKTHESAVKYPALKNRTMAVYSFGKVFHNTGWKMGYCVGPKELMVEFRKVHQFLVFSCNTPVQYALTDFLANPEEYLSLNKFFQAKRDVMLAELKSSRFSLTPAEGTYFQLLNYDGMSEEGDFDFCERLTKEHGVAAIPISAFYHDQHDDHFIRLCFAKSDRTMAEAGRRLSKI
jgi:methionine aminotransferase